MIFLSPHSTECEPRFSIFGHPFATAKLYTFGLRRGNDICPRDVFAFPEHGDAYGLDAQAIHLLLLELEKLMYRALDFVTFQSPKPMDNDPRSAQSVWIM